MKHFFGELFDLHYGEEKKKITLENVENNISFSGANLWILICAILIASIGLNTNSTAVIIGAMLISPLMGPIVGTGFALGIYSPNLLKKSLRNLLIATLCGLIFSSIYFFLTPLKDGGSELLARTTPSLYDVLIAFFGGVAGAVALTRVEKGNPIPGVAIATALMPPLCTAGYGLASGSLNYFFGALYLYTINCVFICIATYAIVKYLNYPLTKHGDETIEKRIHYGIIALTLAMIIPSTLFAINLLQEQQFKNKANLFIEQEFLEKGKTLIYKKISYSPVAKNIELAFLENTFSDAQIQASREHLKNYNLGNTSLSIKENSTINLEDLKNEILSEVNIKEEKLQEIQKELEKNTFNAQELFREITVLFPNIQEISLGMQEVVGQNGSQETPILYYSGSIDILEHEKLKKWVLQKYDFEDIILLSLGQTALSTSSGEIQTPIDTLNQNIDF